MNKNRFLLSKVITYIKLWGIRQTYFKICGRVRPSLIRFPKWPKQYIAIIGCGQFSYSTLASRLLKFGLFSPIYYAYDTDEKALNSFCQAYSCRKIVHFPDRKLDNMIKLAYICSSHSSHFYYTCHFLDLGLDVYCEKPLTTKPSQVFELAKKCSNNTARLYSGYNRPHSPAITNLRDLVKNHYSLLMVVSRLIK